MTRRFLVGLVTKLRHIDSFVLPLRQLLQPEHWVQQVSRLFLDRRLAYDADDGSLKVLFGGGCLGGAVLESALESAVAYKYAWSIQLEMTQRWLLP